MKGSQRSVAVESRPKASRPRWGAPAQLSGPLPGCEHASTPELHFGRLGHHRLRKTIASHLDFDYNGCETAFPISRTTVPPVGLTSGRGDVTAHASRQRFPAPPRSSRTRRKWENWWRGSEDWG
ncbi:hypothetical protein P7K49_031807 [Saguinus oedipus]|uniref:Uncharacterized protein n=1 Tax=Saguinus oedipus TaxID=9490 RepID=A0ABQ9U1C8_SAGOE|nr:hypothetical protein P7K49_031807 [Saguinus oedipus]